jgi:hypothetical protein
MLGVEVNSILYPAPPEPAEHAARIGSDQTPDDAGAAAAAGTGRGDRRKVPPGLKMVLGAGVIGWAIGVVTARRTAR